MKKAEDLIKSMEESTRGLRHCCRQAVISENYVPYLIGDTVDGLLPEPEILRKAREKCPL